MKIARVRHQVAAMTVRMTMQTLINSARPVLKAMHTMKIRKPVRKKKRNQKPITLTKLTRLTKKQATRDQNV